MYLCEKNKEKVGIFKIIVQERKRRNVHKKTISKDDKNEITMKKKKRDLKWKVQTKEGQTKKKNKKRKTWWI